VNRDSVEADGRDARLVTSHTRWHWCVTASWQTFCSKAVPTPIDDRRASIVTTSSWPSVSW
jgi:hypothetical protein